MTDFVKTTMKAFVDTMLMFVVFAISLTWVFIELAEWIIVSDEFNFYSFAGLGISLLAYVIIKE